MRVDIVEPTIVCYPNVTFNLPTYCDGCNAKFTICHALDCKMGGLVTARHNELRDGVADLASRAFTPTHVRNDPLIYQGCAVTRKKAQPAGPGGSTAPGTSPPGDSEQKGDLLIRDLWKNGTDSIHDMRVVNTDVVSYQYKTPEKFLETSECEKKKKYLNTFLNERRHFTPFVASVGGLLGVEVEATLKRIFRFLAQIWKDP